MQGSLDRVELKMAGVSATWLIHLTDHPGPARKIDDEVICVLVPSSWEFSQGNERVQGMRKNEVPLAKSQTRDGLKHSLTVDCPTPVAQAFTR